MAIKRIMGTVLARHDTTANWLLHKDVVPDAGEPCVDTDRHTVRWGDGVTTYEHLPEGGAAQATHYEGVRADDETDAQVIARVLAAANATASTGDIFVVKTVIAEDKYTYTAYVYNGTEWAAMDGNYSAENVYFDGDLLTTAEVGNIKLTNGQATIPANGKNLKELFDTIFVKEANPTITQPSVNLTFAQAKAYEVGTSVTPEYVATLNPGSYEFGPETGVTAEAWEITDTAGNTSVAASGSFPAVAVSDGINYKITAEVTHSAGATPKTNVGNDYAAGMIAAGTKTKESGAITGYRNSFYGTMAEKSTLNSAAIRALAGKSGKALANGAKFNVSVPVGALRVVIAYPATLRDVTSIQDVNGMSAEISSGFAKSTVSVEGANGAVAIDYKVYVMDFANANDAANTFAVTI